MNIIKELEEWYSSQCNEDWEHSYGIEIGNIDNPGWYLKVDLTETDLESKPYTPLSYGIGDNAEISGSDWISTEVEDNSFIGYGGPGKLEELISTFMTWAKSDA